jgi:hypothetical protein
MPFTFPVSVASAAAASITRGPPRRGNSRTLPQPWGPDTRLGSPKATSRTVTTGERPAL